MPSIACGISCSNHFCLRVDFPIKFHFPSCQCSKMDGWMPSVCSHPFGADRPQFGNWCQFRSQAYLILSSVEYKLILLIYLFIYLFIHSFIYLFIYIFTANVLINVQGVYQDVQCVKRGKGHLLRPFMGQVDGLLTS